MIRIVEKRRRYALACYPLAGWIVFRLDDQGEIEDTVINGKWLPVWARYRELANV